MYSIFLRIFSSLLHLAVASMGISQWCIFRWARETAEGQHSAIENNGFGVKRPQLITYSDIKCDSELITSECQHAYHKYKHLQLSEIIALPSWSFCNFEAVTYIHRKNKFCVRYGNTEVPRFQVENHLESQRIPKAEERICF